MTCLICRYYQPFEPPQHKADREAGKCQAYCGGKWDQFTAINYVKRHGPLEGWCRLHPEVKKYAHAHVCGDISVREVFTNSSWGVEPLGPNDNLFEWACKTLGIIVHGTWHNRKIRELGLEADGLRRQLRHSRELSASRLRRLQKAKRKPAVTLVTEPVLDQDQPAEQPPLIPYLVAAE